LTQAPNGYAWRTGRLFARLFRERIANWVGVMTNTRRWKHAIVIGGSIAGLLAARVLSDFFELVTVFERDDIGDQPCPRKGVPQGHQVHVILPRSQAAIQELFPGLLEEMVADGATIYDSGIGLAWIQNGCWFKPGFCDMPFVDCTRPFYETKVHRRVRALPNVAVRTRQFVHSIVPGENGAIVGVECENLNTAERQRIDGDLVVDASGRATHAPRWLDALGFGAPPTEEVRIDLSYVGALYEAPPDFRPAARLQALYPDPPVSWHGGLLQGVEGNRWKVAQWGLFGNHAPLDDAGFMEFSRSLASRELHDFLGVAQRVSGFRRIKIPLSRWYRYDRMRHFPGNFCIIGDAVSSLNPIYAQGMTKAAIHVMYLRDLLRRRVGSGTTTITELLRTSIPAVIERQAWMTTVYGDLVYPQARGRRPSNFRFLTWYIRRIAELASTDLAARKAYQRAVFFEDRMYGLFRPRIFAKAMVYAASRPFVPPAKRVHTGPMPTVHH
jgi:2-polyprenyl-6-methoxyphenol hydroxylase-like FAD-dependent oxidoreductase